MGPSIYSQDTKITDLIGQGEFTLSAEVIPPRNGIHQSKVLTQIDGLVGAGAQFLSVTKGAGGSLRGGSLPIAQAIKERFQRPCIAHFTCRDLTPEEVENQLIDHHYFGIRNILALRGDPPRGASWEAKPGSYNYAYELMGQIQRLNRGEFLDRKGYKVEDRVETDFCVGAAVYPDHPVESERVSFVKAKVEAGAEYGITQMVFCAESLERFLDQMEKERCSLPILVGTRILKSKEQAQRMSERFEVALSKKYLARLPDEASLPAQGLGEGVLEPFFEFVEDLKSLGVAGLHLFVLSDTEMAIPAIRTLKEGAHR